MLYAKIVNGAITQYPSAPFIDHPGTSFSLSWQGGEIEGDEYVVVVPAIQPTLDTETQKVIEATPVPIDGVWTQQWQVIDLTPEELAARLQARREAMVISPLQADLALTQAGLIGAVEAAVAAADMTTQKAWAKAKEFKRLSPLIISLAQTMGWTDTQLDDLFSAAALIEL